MKAKYNQGKNNPFYGKKHTIESREKMRGVRSRDVKFYWTKEWLYHQYIILEKSTGEIARGQNCNAETVRVRLKSFGIDRRRPFEINRGKFNGQWKAEDVGKKSIHQWIRSRKQKPEFCEICNKVPPLDLMCLDHKYRRNVEDYIFACRSCHMKYDHKMGFRGGNESAV